MTAGAAAFKRAKNIGKRVDYVLKSCAGSLIKGMHSTPEDRARTTQALNGLVNNALGRSSK